MGYAFVVDDRHFAHLLFELNVDHGLGDLTIELIGVYVDLDFGGLV